MVMQADWSAPTTMERGSRVDEVRPPKTSTGLRERNKQDKLARIKAAARSIFETDGYDSATLRNIASRADVGLGTLFSYATDKRDLLFLVANDEVRSVAENAADAMNQKLALVDKLLALFGSHYEYFDKSPRFSRALLRELNFYNETQQAERFQATRAYVVNLIQRAIEDCRDDGADVQPDADTAEWASLVFAVYQMELRAWLSRSPRSLDNGLDRLRRVVALLQVGLGPARR